MLLINLPGGTLVSEELCCIVDHTRLVLLLSAHWAAFPPWKPLKSLQTCFVEHMGAGQQHLKYNSEPVCDESSTRKTTKKKLISRLYIGFEWSKSSPSVYNVYRLRVLSHGQSVCAHARLSMHVSPFKCYLLRGEKESPWAPVGRLGPGQRSPPPVRWSLLSSKSRAPQQWGLAHKPVYSDL